MKADHQHTVIALVKNTGKAHNVVGDSPKETGVSGEQGAVDVAAISVHILYDDLIGSAGRKGRRAAAAASNAISRAIGA